MNRKAILQTIRINTIKKLCLILISLLIQFNLNSQLEINLDNRDDYTEQALKEFNRGDWEKGKKTVDDALILYPLDSDLKMLLGKYYHHKKQNDKARYELLKSLEINPNNLDAKQILVNVETETERYSSAICYVNELLEVNPYWKDLWRKKIELYKYQGNIVEAQRLQERISLIYPNDKELRDDYLYGLETEANNKRKEGKIDEAIKISTKLIGEDPNNAYYYLSIANDYLKAGDRTNALKYMEQGLNRFPDNSELINKKAGYLAEENQYNTLLSFLKQKGMHSQYNYYLLEAARHARNNETSTLYGKIFERNPGNTEAFRVIFNHTISTLQYGEALEILKKHREKAGDSKDLYAKELMVYQLMNMQNKANSLTKKLIVLYPNDTDIQNAYSTVMLSEAKNKMAEQRYTSAIEDWYQVVQYGDDDLVLVAQNSIYNAYMELGEYFNALNILNEMISSDPNNDELYLKRSETYLKQKNYHQSLASYEQVLERNSDGKHQIGYAETSAQIVKELIAVYRYDEALKYTERWLFYDTNNLLAFHYAFNIAHLINDQEKALSYAEKGNKAHPEDIFFIVKLAELKGIHPEHYDEIHTFLYTELSKNPYHPDLINSYAQFTETYSLHLIKNKQSQEALEKLNTALIFAPQNNSLKYAKGLAFEKLKEYDSAYYYQSFYEPLPSEVFSFRQHLNYLYYKSLNNEIGLYHMRNRFGDVYGINSISSLSYTRFENKNTFSGRINYAGREPGKGFQIQGEWSRDWNLKTATKLDAAWANQFFPKIIFNGSVYREIEKLKEINIELGLGYRKLDTTFSNSTLGNTDMFNLVVGVTKTFDPFRLNLRFNNFILDNNWLYNLTLNARYELSSPKNYIMAMAGFGSSPDVELVNYQVYDGFSVLNTMVGAGFTHLINKRVSVGVLGTWYNYQAGAHKYRNLYNIFLNLHVAF